MWLLGFSKVKQNKSWNLVVFLHNLCVREKRKMASMRLVQKLTAVANKITIIKPIKGYQEE